MESDLNVLKAYFCYGDGDAQADCMPNSIIRYSCPSKINGLHVYGGYNDRGEPLASTCGAEMFMSTLHRQGSASGATVHLDVIAVWDDSVINKVKREPPPSWDSSITHQLATVFQNKFGGKSAGITVAYLSKK